MKEAVFRCAARYLGAKTVDDAETLRPLLLRAEAETLPAVSLGKRKKRFPVEIGQERFVLGCLPPLASVQLCRLFAGATEGLAVLITLGGEADRLVKRRLLTDPALGAAIGAFASAYVDEQLSQWMAEENEGLREEGLVLSPRFSPGYGDVPLTYQRPLTEALECWRIGVRLTADCLMLPEKSITALCALRPMGSCPERARGEHACERYAMKNCPYREEV